MSGPRVELLGRFGPYEGGMRDGEFHNPEGLASDSKGNILVADETNHRVQKIDTEGRMLWKVGATGPDGRPRPGTGPAEFNWHRGMAVDGDDNVYVADSRNNRVQKLDATGHFLFLFGSHGNGPGQFGGKSGPNGVAVDEDGFIYVTDTHTDLGGNNRVQKFDDQGRFVLSFGEHGTGPGQFAGRVPLRGHAGLLHPEGPYGIDVGARTGHLYIADTDNCRVQVFDRDGGFLRSIGEGVIVGPRQLCLDSQERVYLADFRMAPDMPGLGDVEPVGLRHRFVSVLDRDGRLLVRIGAEDADGLFDHPGGRHHAITVSKVDEGLVYLQAGHMVLEFRIHW